MGILDGILDAVGIGSGGVPWGSIISGASSFFGQQSANESNQQIAQNNSAFNADQMRQSQDYNAHEAQLNRNFQHSMRQTAYQEAVPDMIAAGLNPMLAYSQGGAAQPGGAQASSGAAQAVQPASMQNAAGAGIAAAAQAANIDATQAQARKSNAEADEIESTLIDEQGKSKSGKSPQWNSLKAAGMNAQTGKTVTEARLISKQVDALVVNMDLTRQEIEKVKALIPGYKASSTITQQDIQRAINQGKAAGTWYGRNVAPFLPDILKSTNSATGAIRGLR
ncbi:MAG: DNA pilot protein [Microvirus sp.]|nr:MAG: DNA pilot protein [Microvirus sp.]